MRDAEVYAADASMEELADFLASDRADVRLSAAEAVASVSASENGIAQLAAAAGAAAGPPRPLLAA